MTKNEALEILRQNLDSDSGYERWINAFVALGILKFDQPKSAEELFFSEVRSMGYPWGEQYRADILLALESANLKLTAR